MCAHARRPVRHRIRTFEAIGSEVLDDHDVAVREHACEFRVVERSDEPRDAVGEIEHRGIGTRRIGRTGIAHNEHSNEEHEEGTHAQTIACRANRVDHRLRARPSSGDT
jgi:hypothetical protein